MASYRLEADIDLRGIAWDEAPIQFLGGHLDGAGRTVTGLRVQGDTLLGLFGVLGQNASVVNLSIHDANVTGPALSGLLASINKGWVTGCRADGVISESSLAGGLIGQNEGGISDSYAIGTIANPYSGGLGGLTGRNIGVIKGCYAAAHVAATTWTLGYENVTGGLVGTNSLFFFDAGQVHASYFLIDADAGGPDNGFGIALTDAQMKRQTSFIRWDFTNTWTICEGKDYPRLRWEKVTCNQP